VNAYGSLKIINLPTCTPVSFNNFLNVSLILVSFKTFLSLRCSICLKVIHILSNNVSIEYAPNLIDDKSQLFDFLEFNVLYKIDK
jgi:hypothetical protein